MDLQQASGLVVVGVDHRDAQGLVPSPEPRAVGGDGQQQPRREQPAGQRRVIVQEAAVLFGVAFEDGLYAVKELVEFVRSAGCGHRTAA